MLALVNATKTFAKLNQAEGHTCKPTELLAAIEASASGTEAEKHISTESHIPHTQIRHKSKWPDAKAPRPIAINTIAALAAAALARPS